MSINETLHISFLILIMSINYCEVLCRQLAFLLLLNFPICSIPVTESLPHYSPVSKTLYSFNLQFSPQLPFLHGSLSFIPSHVIHSSISHHLFPSPSFSLNLFPHPLVPIHLLILSIISLVTFLLLVFQQLYAVSLTVQPAGHEHSPVMWWQVPPFWQGQRCSHWVPWLPDGQRTPQLPQHKNKNLLRLAQCHCIGLHQEICKAIQEPFLEGKKHLTKRNQTCTMHQKLLHR